jgi:hypothetical protein
VLDKLVNEMSEGQVFINDDYPVPPILSQIEAIPFEENRGIRGNGGSRKRSYRKRSYRKRSYRKKRGGSRRACMRSSFKKRSLRKRTLKKRYF